VEQETQEDCHTGGGLLALETYAPLNTAPGLKAN
jgi:hypothetical protein